MPLTTNKKELRKFGLVMAGAFLLLAAYLWYREITNPGWIGSIGGAGLGPGLPAPIALAPIEFVWMKIAHVMGFVMTRVILTLVFSWQSRLPGSFSDCLAKTCFKKRSIPRRTPTGFRQSPMGLGPGLISRSERFCARQSISVASYLAAYGLGFRADKGRTTGLSFFERPNPCSISKILALQP